jgi:hypothetical protein
MFGISYILFLITIVNVITSYSPLNIPTLSRNKTISNQLETEECRLLGCYAGWLV